MLMAGDTIVFEDVSDYGWEYYWLMSFFVACILIGLVLLAWALTCRLSYTIPGRAFGGRPQPLGFHCNSQETHIICSLGLRLDKLDHTHFRGCIEHVFPTVMALIQQIPVRRCDTCRGNVYIPGQSLVNCKPCRDKKKNKTKGKKSGMLAYAPAYFRISWRITRETPAFLARVICQALTSSLWTRSLFVTLPLVIVVVTVAVAFLTILLSTRNITITTPAQSKQKHWKYIKGSRYPKTYYEYSPCSAYGHSIDGNGRITPTLKVGRETTTVVVVGPGKTEVVGVEDDL